MRHTILAVCLLLLAGSAFGQSTSVTLQVTDSSSQAWNNGTFQFQLTPNIQYPNLGSYTWTGGTLQQSISGTLNGSGGVTVSIPSNTAITPGGSTWKIQACPAATSGCYLSTATTITGATQTLTLTPPAIFITLINPPGSFTSAYADSEITSTPIGGSYFNLTTLQTRTCTAVTGTTCNTWASAGGGASGVSSVTGTAPIVSSGGSTPAISAPTVSGPVFNAVFGYGAVGDGSTDNSTAFANLASAVNAYSGVNIQDYPTVVIPGGSAGATATYNFASGLSFTRPVTIQCGQGAILNYTGSAHAADMGPTGLTPSNQTNAQLQATYKILGCGWSGGASMTQGIYFNNETAYNVVDNNRFYDFGNATSTVFGVYFSGDNYDIQFSDNKWFNDDNVARNWVRTVPGASPLSTQARITGNDSLNYNFSAGAPYLASVSGVVLWIDGASPGYMSGNNLAFCGPCVRIGPQSQGFKLEHNDFEVIQSGAGTIGAIEFGNPGSATFVDGLQIIDNFIDTHNRLSAMTPASATTGLTNAVVTNIYNPRFFSPFVKLNSVAGQTGNQFSNIFTSATYATPFARANGSNVGTFGVTTNYWTQSMVDPLDSTYGNTPGGELSSGAGTGGGSVYVLRERGTGPQIELILQTSGDHAFDGSGGFGFEALLPSSTACSGSSSCTLLFDNEARKIAFWTGTVAGSPSERWAILPAGHLVADGADNTFDLGASGANRPRTGYFGTSVVAPTGTFSTALTAPTRSPGDSTTNVATTAFVSGAAPLRGTTAAIGGGALTPGSCAAGTATVTGATSSMVASASPSADPDSTLSTGIAIYAFVSSSNTVTVRVCAIVTVTPASTTYNVAVIQ